MCKPHAGRRHPDSGHLCRLLALHALGYLMCFGLIGLQIALDDISPPRPSEVTISITMPEPELGERALSDGIAFYNVATTQESLGIRSEAVPSALARARDCLTAASRTLHGSRAAEAYYRLGDSYLHGDLDPIRAERFLLRALELDDTHYRAATSLAKCYELMGLPIQESTAWERALAVNPSSAQAHKSAALAYFRSSLPDRIERAYDHAMAALRLAPSLQAELTEVLDAGEQADDELANALSAAPEKPEANVSDIIDRGHSSQRLSDAEAERYAEEIGRLLQER